MKKLVLVLLSCFMLVGCTGLKTYEKISYKKLMSKLDNKESFILYIGSSNCGACADFKPTLEAVIKKYQVKVYYIDSYKLSDEQYRELNNVISYGGSTPTVAFIKDGAEGENPTYNRIKGSRDQDYVIEKFKKNGYIEE